MSDFNFEEYANSMAMPVEEFEKISLQNRLINSKDPEERKQIWDWLESRGFVAPEENNVFTEAGEALAQSAVSGLKGLGATLNELGMGDSLQNYAQDVLDRNQQWNASENQGVGSYIARGIGSALGSTGAALTAGAIGTALGGAPVGAALGIGTTFAQTFGDNVQRNRAAGYDDNSAAGMAFLESGIDAAIENMPWGIVGKGGKIALNLNRLRKISGAGKKALLNKITERMVSQIGRDATENLIVKWGKQAALEGLGESGEEGLQYLNSYVNRVIGGDPNAEFSIDELADSMAQGFIGGFGLGLGQQAPGVIAEANRRRKFRKLGETPQPSATPSTPAETDSAAAQTEQPQTSATVAQTQQVFNPLTDLKPRDEVEKEIQAKLDSIQSDEELADYAESLKIKFDRSTTHPQQVYNMILSKLFNDHRNELAQAQAEAEAAATVQTPVTPSNTAVEATPETETDGQGTLAFGSPETAPAVAENTADETAPVPAPVETAPTVPAVDIPDAPSPMDIAQTEINTQAMEESQIRSDEEAEALANEIESEIRQQEEEDAIFDDYESGNYSDNQLAYAPASEANITTPSTAELDAEKKISALKKAESDLNLMRERVAERQGEAPETMESVKISEFDQSKIADKTMQRNLKLAQRIFDALGMGKVVTVETSKEGAFFGVTIRRDNAADNYTFLNMSDIKNNPAFLFNRAMHELIHDLIGNNKKAYNELRDKIISPLKGESWFDSSLKEYAEGRGFDLSIPAHKAACEEEFICDTVADLMQTEMFWQTLVKENVALYKKILEALKDLLTKVQKSFGKVPDKVSAEFTRQLKNRIELAQKFITEASGKSKEDLLSAVMPEETTQAASAENAQTTGKLFESSEKRKSQNEVPKKGTPKENLEVAPSAQSEVSEVSDKSAPSDQAEQTTEKTSIPSTPSVPSEPQAKQTSEQVESKPSKSKTESKEQKPEVQSATDKITSSPAGSNTRIMAFTELADGEHTVNGKTFTKKGNAFTLDGKELNAREIEKATRTKTEKIKATPKAEEKPSDKSGKIPDAINEKSSEKEIISFLENHYDRIDSNTKDLVFSMLVNYLRETPLHLKAIPQKTKVKSKKLFDALFPFTNNKDNRAAYTVVNVTDKEMTAIDGKVLVVAQNTSRIESGAYSLKKRQIAKEEISKYPDLSIITSKKYADSTNADSLLTDGRVDGTVDIYNKLLDYGVFRGTAPVILKFGKSSIQVDATNLKKVLDLFKNQGIENITVSSSTQETKFDSERILISNIIRIQGGNISAYIIGLNPDVIGDSGIAEIAIDEKVGEQGKNKAETASGKKSDKSEVSDKSEKIEDYGEKIGGAKKDRYTDTIREKIVGNYTDEEIFGLSVDKLFPKLDYEKLAADGMKKSSIAILKAARETLPHKPSDKWKYKKNGYISAIRQTLEVAQSVLDGKMDLETLQKRVNDAYSELADLDRQLEEKKNKFPDGATVTQAEYNQNEKEIFDIYSKKSDVYDRSRLDMKLIDATRAIELINIPMSDYRFDYEILSNATYRNGKQDYNYRSYRINRSIYSLTSRLNDEHSIKDVARVIEEDLKKRAESGKGKSTEKSTLPRTITIIAHAVSENNKRKLVYEIVSDTGRKGITLKDGFETAQAAAEFFKSEEGKAELEKRWAEFKDIKHYNPQESPRQGKDYRNGRNITAQELAETFGFRGVEFGNWADQNNRQKRLNETYDALMDMAAILDISPRAVGLGGKLGMAFGSRGSGWANAHFETNAFVINITKTRGAGSLAHEWLHALDNYFASQSDSRHGWATDMHELNLKNMRDELKEKWMGLRRTLEFSAMKRRSNKHSDYWSRIWEVAARAFSRYIQDKAIANNMSNDYLVSLFPEELLTEIQKETTPYALAEDMVAITPVFDAFFDTLQEKVDESGNTVLFSMVGDQRRSIQRRDQTLTEIANLDMKNEITKVIEEGIPEGKYVFKSADDKQKIIDGAVKFLKDFSKKIVSLSDGRIAYFMPDSRAFERGSATAWAEYGIHAVTSSGKQILGKDYNERLFNQHKLDNLDRIVPTIKDENVFGKFDNKNPVKDGVVFVGTSHDGKRLEVITRLDEYGNPQADLTEVTVVEKNPQRKVPPLAPLTEVVEAVARHQEAGYSPSTTNNITSPDSKVNPVSSKNPEKSSGGVKFSMSGDLGDNRINWDNEKGMGATPDNANIDYRGFQIELSAAEFRNLTPSGRMTTDLSRMKKAISDGEGVASPTLYADWNEQKKRWEVTDHEGRSRSDAISELYGAETLMPVHIMPYKLRARDITQEMLDAPFVGQGLSGYDWATEYKFPNSRREVQNEEAKFSISDVWTGSAADYDKPSLLYIGTGEGSQVYGWGLYGSESRKVAEWYADKDAKRKSSPEIILQSTIEDFMVGKTIPSDPEKQKSFFSAAIDYAKNALRNQIKDLESLLDIAMTDNGKQRYEKQISLREEMIGKLPETDIEPYVRRTRKQRNLYRQTFFADKDHNLIDWGERVPKDLKDKILAQAEKENIFAVPEDERFDQQDADEVIRKLGNYPNYKGQILYQDLSYILDSPKAASEFLYRAGIDGITYIGDSSGVRNYVAFSDKDIRVDEHIRFSLTTDLGDTSLSPMDYRRSIDPLFDFVMEYTDNGIVNPGKEHEGEYFTGSFISREYIAYSEKKPQGKNQSDKQYQQYLERREQALDNAEGTPLDEIAAAYVRKFGGDEKEIAEQILDMLRDLTKRDLISDRAEAKREVAEHEKEQRKEDKAEYAKMKDAELTKQVNELFESKEAVTVDKRWVQMHRQIYPKLYKTVFPNAENVPDIPSSREMAIINEALSNGKMSEAAKVAEPYLTDKNLKAKGEIDETTHHYLMDIIRKWFPIIKKIEHYFRSEKGKEDLGIFRRVLASPMWIAKHFKDNPVVKAIYQASQDLLDDRARISNYLNAGTIEKLNNLRKQNKEEYKKLNEYILKSDRDQTGAGVVKGDKDTLMWTAQDADGNVIGGYKTEEEAWAALFENEKNKAVENGIMSEAAADALFAFRDAMRRAYLFRIDTTLRALRQVGLINVDSTSFIIENAKEFFPDADVTGKIDLFELMREMGQRSGYYVPRIRHGRYMIKATKAGEPTILKGFETLDFVNRAWEIGKLERAGYKVETFVSNATSQDMMGQVNPAAMMDIINQATIRANEKMKNDLTFEEVTYTKKDGTKEQHLVLSPDAKLNSQTVTLLKNMGGMFIDGAWHFINSDITVRNNLEEVLKGQALTEAKMQTVMQSAIGASLVDMIRENGAGSSKIQRRTAKGDDVIRGYEEDLEKIAGLYLNGVAGSAARNIMAKKMYAAFGGMCFDREKYITDLIPEGLEEGTPEYYKARLNATAEYYKEVQRLALNSAKQPALTKYMDSYIKDMLRNTTGLEIGLGFLKGLSAVWLLTRPSGALNNLIGGIATNPAVIHGATNCGLMYAAKQVGAGAGLYNQYLFWNKYGKGKSLPPKNQELFDIIHENGWDGAELTKSATQAGLTFAGKGWKWLSEKLLKMFSLAEQTNRAAAIYASVQALCRQKGIDFNTLSKNDKYKLVKQAKDISDFGNGVYNKGNKLGFTRGGGWGAVADSAMLFQTYSVNYIDIIDNALEEGNLRGAAWLMTITALAGGMKISVLGTILATLAGIGFADDGEEKDEAFYRVVAENMGQWVSDILKYGLPTLAGVNMSGTYQDMATDLMHDGLWDGNANIAELPAFSIFRNMSNFFEYAGSGQGVKAAEQFMPSWGASISRAVREANDGVTDRQGKRRKDVHDEYITADGYDTALRLLGFNPIDISEKTDRVYSEKKVKEKFSEMRKDITTDYRNIILDGNPSNEELADIAMRIEEYNAKARRSKRNVPFIDAATLNNAVKDKDNKFLKDDLDEKDKKRIEKKSKGKIVIRNGKLVKE